MIATTIGAAAEGLIHRLLSPACPRYPDLSVFVGCLSSWFYNFAAWAGLGLGILGWPILALAARGRAVKWARLPPQERLMCLVAGPIAAIVPLVLLSGQVGVFPPAGLCKR